VPRHLEPFGVLVEHRVDDVDERLVAREEAVTAGEQVALQPALTLVLAEHLHDSAVARQVVVGGEQVRLPDAGVTSSTSCQRLEVNSSGLNRRKSFRPRFIFITSRRYLPMTRVASAAVAPGRRHVHGVGTKVRELQVFQQHAAVGVRVGAHAPDSRGRQLRQLRDELARRVE